MKLILTIGVPIVKKGINYIPILSSKVRNSDNLT